MIWKLNLQKLKRLDPDMEVGDDYIEQITLESFGRRAILAARQTLVSKILELEKDEIFKKYKDRVGEIVTGEVYQVWKKETLVLDDEGNELMMPKTEQIPADYFKKGDTVRAVISKGGYDEQLLQKLSFQELLLNFYNVYLKWKFLRFLMV